MFKGRGGDNVKEPDFFFFVFVFLVLVVFLLGGGVACFSGETEGA